VNPLYDFYLKKTKSHENLAALLASLTVASLVVIPVLVVCIVLIAKGIEAFQLLKGWVQAGKFNALFDSANVQSLLQSAPCRWALEFKEKYLPDLVIDRQAIAEKLLALSQSAVSLLGERMLPFIQNVGNVGINFVLMLFIMFYFFRDGDQIVALLKRLNPLSVDHSNQLVERIKAISKSAISGTILTSVAQSGLSMIAFAGIGLPWFFLGTMLGLASLIPVVGTAIIWLPCAIYLAIIGAYGKAAFLAVWCIVVVGLADNVLRPYLMQGDTGLSSFVLFFSILGGIQLFGLIGVLYGPLIVGIGAVLLMIYELGNQQPDGYTNRH
jgi:predicted PurR-regulated permease PerM